MLDIILISAGSVIMGLTFTAIYFQIYVIGKSAPALTEQVPQENTSAQVYPIHYF